MGTTLHTFMDIFKNEIESDGERIQVQKIEIPIIQRDYAQGRRTDKIDRIRSRFLDSLYQAVCSKPITLDFVYGDVDEKGVMTPLDGQQRLTTLFLLHWYAAKKEKIAFEDYAFLQNFSYETRYSARSFCRELIQYNPSLESLISEEIIDQAWFPLEWKKDPTIKSMLVMLDAIHAKFHNIEDLWKKLQEGAISFYFLPIKEMGLTDELYIKMNSRGKPLTQFEHFKAELERNIRGIDANAAAKIMQKIDIDWTDVFWAYRGEDHVIDDEFLRYFKFVCDIICYKNGGTPQGRSYDEFFLLNTYFSNEAEHVVHNIELLQQYFDCWCKLKKEEKIKDFFTRIFSNKHEPAKVQLRGELDLFEDCLENYADHSSRSRKFPLNRVVLLYAVIVYLLHRDSVTNGKVVADNNIVSKVVTDKVMVNSKKAVTDENNVMCKNTMQQAGGISEEQFVRRMRIINNLVRNSEDEISDSTIRSSGNRMPVILQQVDDIMLHEKMDAGLVGLSTVQMKEEIEKLEWTKQNADKAEALFALEDHYLLFGQIGIVGLEHVDCFEKFEKLFACDLDKVDCALMATGNYIQCERNSRRYQLGTGNRAIPRAWQDLFHKSSNSGYENTKQVLYRLLSNLEKGTNKELTYIADAYIQKCEAESVFDWRYYYVKYKVFRPASFGKYYWPCFEEEPYVVRVMLTSKNLSENSYQPFLKAVDKHNLISKDDYGEFLIEEDGKTYIGVEQSEYVIYSMEDYSVVNRIPIAQNEKLVDVEDRIKKLEHYLKRKS